MWQRPYLKTEQNEKGVLQANVFIRLCGKLLLHIKTHISPGICDTMFCRYNIYDIMTFCKNAHIRHSNEWLRKDYCLRSKRVLILKMACSVWLCACLYLCLQHVCILPSHIFNILLKIYFYIELYSIYKILERPLQINPNSWLFPLNIFTAPHPALSQGHNRHIPSTFVRFYPQTCHMKKIWIVWFCFMTLN